MSVVVVLLVLGLFVAPMIIDGPTRSRRRRGITVWDEMWARGEITAEQLYRIKATVEDHRRATETGVRR